MPQPMIGHLVQCEHTVVRKSDNIRFRFEIYRYRHEWGWNLVSADGNPTSCVSDPDWNGPKAVAEWLDENIEGFAMVKGLGWCTHCNEKTSVVVPENSTPKF